MRRSSSGPSTWVNARSASAPRQPHLTARRQALADGATHLGEQRVLLRARKLEGHLAPGDDLVSEPEQHVVVQPAGEAQGQLHLRRSDQPLMGRTEIVQLPVDDRDPLGLVRAAQPEVGLFGDRCVVAGVPEAHGVGLVLVAEMRPAVGPQGLQQRVPDPAFGRPDGDHRRVHQRGQQVDHLTAFDAVAGADLFGGGEVEASGEHREPVEQASLGRESGGCRTSRGRLGGCCVVPRQHRWERGGRGDRPSGRRGRPG